MMNQKELQDWADRKKKMKRFNRTGRSLGAYAGVGLFLLLWLALAIVPVLVVAHFVIKYW